MSMTVYEKIQSKSPEELAELFAVREIALADIVFRQVERVLREKRGISIDFNKHFKPDLLSTKQEVLKWLDTEVPDGTAQA